MEELTADQAAEVERLLGLLDELFKAHTSGKLKLFVGRALTEPEMPLVIAFVGTVGGATLDPGAAHEIAGYAEEYARRMKQQERADSLHGMARALREAADAADRLGPIFRVARRA